MKNIRVFFISLFLGTATSVLAGVEPVPQPASTPAGGNNLNLFDYEMDYTFSSNFYDVNGNFGHGNSLYNDFSYSHRFRVTGNWYFRAGAEYERFDFGGTDNGLPDHLQTIHALLAFEYVVHDHAGAGIEIDPGVYFQNNPDNAFDIPWKAFVSFPLMKDKIFGVIGVGGALNQSPVVAPGGGIIWLFNDHLRLEGVFPKPALVYNPSDDWEFRLYGNLYYESFRTEDVITPERKLQVHDAWVQYNEDRVGVQATYSGFKPFEIHAGAGCTVERRFDFFRAEASARARPAPFVMLEIEARF